MTRTSMTLEELAGYLRSHPALRAKREIGLVSDVLGAGSWVHGPGDDGAVVDPTNGRRAGRSGDRLRRGVCCRHSWPPTHTAPESPRS